MESHRHRRALMLAGLAAVALLGLLAALVWGGGGGTDAAYVTEPLPVPSEQPSSGRESTPPSLTASPAPSRASVMASATRRTPPPRLSPRRSSSRPSAPEAGAGATTILNDGFNRTGELTRDTNGTNADWWVEPGSGPFVLTGSTLKRTGNTEFDRMFSRKRYGGPGKTVRYRYRARMTQLYPDNGWAGFRGIKTGMKFPSDCSPFSKDDPRSAYGKPPGGSDACTPGSYITVDGILEDGRYEVARNGYGPAGYDFLFGPKRAYRVGEWVEKTVEISWIGGDDVRFRFWNNATGSGAPVWETTDTSSPFAQPGFLWWRLDFADGEWDYFLIEERPTRR